MDDGPDYRDCAFFGPWSPYAETLLFFPFVAGSHGFAFTKFDDPELQAAMDDKVRQSNLSTSCCIVAVAYDPKRRDECCDFCLCFPVDLTFFILGSVLCGPCSMWLAYKHQEARVERRLAQLDPDRLQRIKAREQERQAAEQTAKEFSRSVQVQVDTWAQLLQASKADWRELEKLVLLAHGREPSGALDKRALPWLCHVLAAGPPEEREAAQRALVAYVALPQRAGASAGAWQKGGDLRATLGPERVADLTKALRPRARDLVRRLAAGAADDFEKELLALLLPDPSFQEARGQAEALLVQALFASAPDVQAAACRALARLAAAYRQAGVLAAPSQGVVDALIMAAWRSPGDARSLAVVTLREVSCFCPAVRDAATGTMATLAACNSGGRAGLLFNARGACKALAYEPTCRTILAGMDPPLEYDVPMVAPATACGLTGTAPDKDGFRSVPYWFVKASKIKSWQDGDPPLPRYQDLLKKGDWLELVLLSPHACFEGYYRPTMLAVSHRWEEPGRPDPASTQLKILRKFLCEHPHIDYVWLDWYCMPQGDDRTDKEKTYFKLALTNINILYLGLTVLSIFDLQYGNRFWCLFEAWCAMRLTTAAGLSAPPLAKRRLHVRCAGAAAGEADSHVKLLFEAWEHKTPAQLRDKLGKDDVMVTNQGDKVTQLQKLAGIEQFVKQVCSAKMVLDLSPDDTELLPVLQASERLWKTAAPPVAQQMLKPSASVVGKRDTE